MSRHKKYTKIRSKIHLCRFKMEQIKISEVEKIEDDVFDEKITKDIQFMKDMYRNLTCGLSRRAQMMLNTQLLAYLDSLIFLKDNDFVGDILTKMSESKTSYKMTVDSIKRKKTVENDTTESIVTKYNALKKSYEK